MDDAQIIWPMFWFGVVFVGNGLVGLLTGRIAAGSWGTGFYCPDRDSSAGEYWLFTLSFLAVGAAFISYACTGSWLFW